LTVAA
jgi:hypothetical protein